MALLGTPVPRVEDARLLTGGAQYVSNLDLPGAAAVAYLVSTEAHARLVRVDVSAARKAPGVLAVLTGADVGLPPAPGPIGEHAPKMLRPYLAVDTVRFVGDPIVAVVGETAAACEDALELVAVDYEPLAPVLDPLRARSEATLLFPAAGTNIVATQQGGTPRPLPFDECEVVFEADFHNQRVAPCPLETRAAASLWDAEGRLHHWSSCQGAHPVRAMFAQCYGLETSQVRVVAPDVGGSFGAKGRPTAEELLLPVLAKHVGRPVRWVPPRGLDMLGLGHGRAQHHHVRIGGDRDGTVRCVDVEIVVDAGAYPGISPVMGANAGSLLPGPYRVPAVAWSVETVVTNTTPTAPYRGAGRPEAAALMERALDMFAARIGMDPVVVRRRNLLTKDEFPHTAPSGIILDSGDYERAVDLLLSQAGYVERREEQARRRAEGSPVHLGIGLACFVDRTAGYPAPEYGAVQLRPDGGLRVLTGSSPYGQGHHTSWAMLASDRTGVPLERIQVVHGDTDVVPRGEVTGGSRSAQIAGTAVSLAADQLVEEALPRAADLLEAALDDVVLDRERGRFHVAGAPGAITVDWADIAAAIGDGEPLHCETDYTSGRGSFPFGAYLAVVSVDEDTGAVRLERIVTVDDAGTILNPLIAHGQVHGAVAQGVAQALFEEVVYDDTGNPVGLSFADYLLPSAAELPSFECSLVETPSPLNPYGFKGIAESGCLGATPAVQNAVVDALSHLGVRHLEMPLSPERVWRAIADARATMG